MSVVKKAVFLLIGGILGYAVAVLAMKLSFSGEKIVSYALTLSGLCCCFIVGCVILMGMLICRTGEKK